MIITEGEKREIKRVINKFIVEENIKRRGRKSKLKKSDGVFLLVIRTIEKLSYINLYRRGLDFYPSLPHYTNIFRLIKKIEEREINLILILLSNIIENILIREYKRKYKKSPEKLIIADGTGFGYNRPYYLRYERGEKIKQISSHVKTEVVIGVIGRKRYLKAVLVGEAYKDERVMLKEMIRKGYIRLKGKGNIFIGDKLYGMDNELLEELERRFDKLIIKVEDGIHNKVKSNIRLKVKRWYEGDKLLYKKRFNVEGFIGNVKNRYGSYEESKIYESAKSLVLGKFLAYALGEYIKISGKGVGERIFYFLILINLINIGKISRNNYNFVSFYKKGCEEIRFS